MVVDHYNDQLPWSGHLTGANRTLETYTMYEDTYTETDLLGLLLLLCILDELDKMDKQDFPVDDDDLVEVVFPDNSDEQPMEPETDNEDDYIGVGTFEV